MMTNNIWQVDEADFPEQGSLPEKITFWLRYAILAPSAHNTQPWRVEIVDNKALIYRDPEFTLKQSDSTLRETFLGLGAFLENLIIAAAHWGYAATVTSTAFTTAEMLAAEVSFALATGAGTEADPDLFKGITLRHTNRGHYQPEPIDPDVLTKLQVPHSDEIAVTWVTDPAVRSRIAALVGQSTAMALSVQTMQRELAELTFREAEQRPVGMMVEALSETPPEAVDGATWVTGHMNPQEHGAYWQETFTTSPLHVVISSQYDGPETWIEAGRTMERILVKAAALGLSHCISAGPIEVPTLVPLLREEIEDKSRPQALFRLGLPVNPAFTRHSTRRGVAAVVS